MADWDAIAKKYRKLVGSEIEETGSNRENDNDNASNVTGSLAGGGGGGAAPQQIGNNAAAANQV